MEPERCWIIKYNRLSDSTYADLSSYSSFFVTALTALLNYLHFIIKSLSSFNCHRAQTWTFLQNALLYTTFKVPYAISIPEALSMSVIWNGPSHFHLLPHIIINDSSDSLYQCQLMTQCFMRPHTSLHLFPLSNILIIPSF